MRLRISVYRIVRQALGGLEDDSLLYGRLVEVNCRDCHRKPMRERTGVKFFASSPPVVSMGASQTVLRPACLAQVLRPSSSTKLTESFCRLLPMVALFDDSGRRPAW